jgi:hypothetical protein
MGAKSRALRAHLADRSVAMAASAHNMLSARLVEQVGFPVLWASGLELSAAKGVPDATPGSSPTRSTFPYWPTATQATATSAMKPPSRNALPNSFPT